MRSFNLVAICLAACAPIGEVCAQQEVVPSTYPWEAHDAHRVMLMGVNSPDFVQRFRLTMAGRSVSHSRMERGDESQPWRREEKEYTTSYFLTSWCARQGGDEIFLCGLDSTGETVIERWRFTVPSGRWVVRYPGPSPAVGTAAPLHIPEVTVLGGGEWQYRNTRIFPPNPQRSTILRANGPIYTSLAVDPEGRQLLLYDHISKSINSIRLNGAPSVAEPIFSVTDYPHLSQVANLEIRDFGDERTLLTWKQYAQTYSASAEVHGVGNDSNNDGIFESVTFYDAASFSSTPYANWSDWKEFWRLN